ncbi:MAG: hypothetical protein ACPLZH_03610 [Minisyncoccales bacterium]
MMNKINLDLARKVLKNGKKIFEDDSWLGKFMKFEYKGKEFFLHYDDEKDKILDFGEIIKRETELDQLKKKGWKPISKVFILDEEYRKQFFIDPEGHKKVIIFHISEDIEEIRDPKIKFKTRRNFVIHTEELFLNKVYYQIGGDGRFPIHSSYYKHRIYLKFGIFKKEKKIKLLDVKIEGVSHIWDFSGDPVRDSWIGVGKGLEKGGGLVVYKQIKFCEFLKDDLDNLKGLIIEIERAQEKIEKKYFG